MGELMLTRQVPHGLFVQSPQLRQKVEIHEKDFSGLRPQDRNAAIARMYPEQSALSASTAGGIGIQATVAHLGPMEHVVILSMDHLCSDRWSIDVLRKEVISLYQLRSAGLPWPERPKSNFLDYAQWEFDALESPCFDSDLDYWTDHWREYGSARIGPGDLPFSRFPERRSPEQTYRSSSIHLDNNTKMALREKARAALVSQYSLFLAAYLTVLFQYTRKGRFAVWCKCSNRASTDTQQMIGYFTNTHLMGFDFDQDMSLDTVLRNVADRVLSTIEHQAIPLPHLWRTLKCRPQKNDLQIGLEWIPMPSLLSGENGSVTFEHADIESSAPSLQSGIIGIRLFEQPEGILVRMDYLEQRFAPEGIQKLLADFKTVLASFIERPGARIADLPFVGGRQGGPNRARPSEMGPFLVYDDVPPFSARNFT
jgi:hypothetical protein